MKNLIPKKWREKVTVPSPFKKKNWLSDWWENPNDHQLSLFNEPLFKFYPHTNVNETRDKVEVSIDIPGMNAKDLDLSYRNGVLHVEGETKNENSKKRKNSNYYEYSYNRVCRNIDVGKNVLWDKAKAKYKNGVLKVMLPKTQSAQKVIEVKVD